MLIGEKIKNLRKNRRLTQEELGKLINTDGNTVSRWERDKLGVGSAYVAKLAEALGTTTDYLLNGEKTEPEGAPKNPGNNLLINNNAPENETPEYLDLGYWGNVADNAKRAARSNPKELSLVAALLQTAMDSIKGCENNSSTITQAVTVNGENNKITDFMNTKIKT